MSSASLSNLARNSPMTGTNMHPSTADGEDVYFSADVETDGAIPGPYSMLSFALVYAGRFDGRSFVHPPQYDQYLYRELKPISNDYEPDALRVNGLNREKLRLEGDEPVSAMTEAAQWVRQMAGSGRPVLVAYPLSFDWTWLYWYFVRFSLDGSPFNHSSCFDIKTAYAVKAHLPIARAGRSRLDEQLRSSRRHTHNALDDAIEQAEVFSRVFRWREPLGISSE
jgi:Exonuclease